MTYSRKKSIKMNKEGVVIAFDFGLKRIGCAVGQKITGTASPIGTIKNNKKDIDWNKINSWLNEWQPQAIIVGVTQQADGSASPIENEIKKFIRNLREKKIPIHVIDEVNSSIEAKRIIKAKRQAGVIKKQKKEIIDSISAAIIAERWLNES